MPLILPMLTGQLLSALQTPTDQGGVAAQRWAAAYNTYAAVAQAGVLLPIFVGLEAQAMVARLASVMTNPSGNAAQFANALASGVEAFWLFPPVLFAGPGVAGVVTSFPGKGALVAQLVGILSSTTDQNASVAQRIASALDTATRTVIVTFAPPPGSTAPLV